MLITAVKDFYEDLSRKKSDRSENQNKCNVLTAEGLQERYWESLLIGDVIKVSNKEFFPADVVLLKSSDLQGLAYIETKNLDGETNMKHKKVLEQCQQTLGGLSDPLLFSAKVKVKYEKPNPFIYLFQGNMTLDGGQPSGLDSSQMALRGCSLRNTEYVYGLVVYTGDSTKIMLNSMKARAKVSNVMRQMNKYILAVVALQVVFCMTAAGISVF